jgi:hypothetical protein
MRFKQALFIILLPLVLLAAACPARAEIGISPERACKLLRAWNFKTDPYAKHGAWHVCEAVKTISSGQLNNTLAYQVVGEKKKVHELRLELSVDDPRKQGEAKKSMIQAALHMASKLGARDAPHGLEEALRRGSEGRWSAGRAIITLVKLPVPDPPRGYRLILTAR